MPMNKPDVEEFKFPDEIEDKKNEAEASDDLVVEVEDDTPPEDRGRAPMPKELVQELEKDELDSYDEGVKTKLKQMRKVWHDERREKESALREQQEAVAFAQKLLEENKKIKNLLSVGEKEYASTVKSAAEAELVMAKKAYKEAYEAGDADKLLDAQQELTAAQWKLSQAQNFRLPALHTEENVVQTRQQVQAPSPDRKAIAWQQRNPWYGQDEEMTAAALGLHQKLVRSGAAIGTESYYATLDETMRRRFPEAFAEESEKPAKAEPKAKPSTVVAPATRSTSSNKIKLTATQVQLAKKFGLTPEQYARAALKLENANG
jgi:hypothetical protein